jgi:NAD(P)-dependent dehydrogenase (short-subunit alcohol dehydrogenase family)
MDTTQHHELLKRTLAGRTGTPDEAAEFIYYLAVSASYLTGAVIPFDGGFLLGANRVGDMPKGILE